MRQKQQNQHPLDIRAYNLANKQSFQNLTSKMSLHFTHLWTIGQEVFCQISKRWFIGLITGQNVQKMLIFGVFAS